MRWLGVSERSPAVMRPADSSVQGNDDQFAIRAVGFHRAARNWGVRNEGSPGREAFLCRTAVQAGAMRGTCPSPKAPRPRGVVQGLSALVLRIGRLLAAVGMLGGLLAQPLPGTAELAGTPDQDRAADMVDGLRTYLDRAAAQSADGRDRLWRNASDSASQFESHRIRFREVLGL